MVPAYKAINTHGATSAGKLFKIFTDKLQKCMQNLVHRNFGSIFYEIRGFRTDTIINLSVKHNVSTLTHRPLIYRDTEVLE